MPASARIWSHSAGNFASQSRIKNFAFVPASSRSITIVDDRRPATLSYLDASESADPIGRWVI
jgi:hypothetical protein